MPNIQKIHIYKNLNTKKKREKKNTKKKKAIKFLKKRRKINIMIQFVTFILSQPM